MKRFFFVNPQYPELTAFCQGLPDTFEQKGEVVYDKRNQLRYMEVNGHALIVKRYKAFNFFQGLFYAWKGSNKAIKAYENAHELLSRDVATPSPVAWVFEQSFWRSRRAYYVCKYAVGVSVEDAMLQMGEQCVLKSLAVFFAKIHDAGIFHRDLNSSNVLCTRNDDETVDFLLIDINRMCFYSAPLSKKARMKNLACFTWNRELYAQLLTAYAEVCHYDVDTFLREAMQIKARHERRWHLRKWLAHPIREHHRLRLIFTHA